MTPKTAFLRDCGGLLAVFTLVLTACPVIGRDNSSNCAFIPNYAWNASGFQHYLSQPDWCPIEVSGPGTPVNYAASVQAPSYNVYGYGDWLTTDVYNSVGQPLTGVANQWYQYSYGVTAVDIAFTYLAGTNRQAATSFSDDAINQSYSSYGLARGSVRITYRLGALASLQGPISPTPGTNPTWTASVTNATSPYTYRWFKDDVEIAGQTSSSLQLPVTNSFFTLKVIGQASAGGSDTLSAQIIPSWNVNIYGMSELAPGVHCGYASDTGTNPSGTFTYQWTLDGATLPDNGSTSNPDLSAGTHILELSVTDDNGYTARNALTINVTPGGPSNCV